MPCVSTMLDRKDTCMHYLANMLTNQQERFIGQAVYPTAWQNGECRCYCEKRLVRKAWGFAHLYDNVPRHQKTEARQCVRSYFSAGMGPYYRYHHGENKLSPKQQADIMKIMSNHVPLRHYRRHPFRPLRNRLGLRMTYNVHSLNNQSELLLSAARFAYDTYQSLLS